MNVSSKFDALLEARKRLLPSLEANAQKHDSNGSYTNLLGQSHRFIGVAEYLSKGDPVAFRTKLALSASCRLDLLRRYDEGKPISPSYVAVTGCYRALFDSLAACDDDMTLEIAQRLGGRPSIEKTHDHQFDIALGYALKASVLESSDRETCLSELKVSCSSPGNLDFAGYCLAMELMCSDTGETSECMEQIVQGHRNQTRNNGVFKGTEDEALSVWGIGIANLLVRHGKSILIDCDLIPRRLIRQAIAG